jgi:hypothetical protein
MSWGIDDHEEHGHEGLAFWIILPVLMLLILAIIVFAGGKG